MKRLRVSYANVVSSLALFVALGGISYAAIKIPANSVGSAQIKSSAVTSSDIKNGQVKEADVGTSAVSANKLKSGAVGSAALAAGAVGTDKLADGGVSGGKLADGAVSGGKIADGSVATGKLADGAVNGAKIGDGSVGNGDLADNAANGAKIADGSVSSSDLADGTIIPGDLGSDLISRAVAAYASIDGFGPTIQQPYNKNVLSVTRNGGAGRYCLNVDWAAAGRSPAQQATPVIASARSYLQQAAGDVYNPSCANNGVSVILATTATGTPADGWVHVLIP